MTKIDMKDLRLGIEIECVKRTREQVAWAVQSVVGGDVKYIGTPGSFDPWHVTSAGSRQVWKIVSDGSLSHVPFSKRAEVVSPILFYEDIEMLQQVVRKLREIGAKSDEFCSVHIHVADDLFDGRTLANLAKIVYKQEDLIVKALGVTPNRLHKYTRKTSDEFIRKIERAKPKTKADMNRLWYGRYNSSPQHYDSTRYRGLNFHSLFSGTGLEFRYFSFGKGLHAGKVKAWIQFCLALCAKALNSKAASSKKRVVTGTSDKYDFRVFLLSLKLSGDEFKTARKHLLAKLEGSAAWKNGRPTTPPASQGQTLVQARA